MTKQKVLLENYKKDFEPIYYENIVSKISNFHELSDTKKLLAIKNKMSDIHGYTGIAKQSLDYWLMRGWKEEIARFKRKENKKTRKGKSLFSKEYWLNKGYSEEEAEYERNKIRPIKREYWLNKGYSEEEAELKAKETKKKNNKKGLKKSNEAKYYTPACLEYWLLKGYREEEAKQKLSERQTTFSLEICIEKYGEDEGKKRWQERQNKWLQSLDDKPYNEKVRIKINKNPFKLKRNEKLEIYKRRILKNKVHPIIDKDSLYKFLKNKYESSVFNRYMTVDIFKKKYLPKRCFCFLSEDEIDSVLSLFEFNNEILEWTTNGGFKFFNKYDEKTGKFLRSMREIVFCDLLKKYNIDYDIELYYNNSNMRCDFYLNDYDVYIEIAGNMRDEIYKNKMYFKQETFGSIILIEENQYENFCKSLVCGDVNENKFRISV